MIEILAVNTLYFLALTNPVSKISILSTLVQGEDEEDIRTLSLKSTLAAAGILLVSMLAGEFIFNRVFRVELYSLQIAGGAILFWVGFEALHKGVFFEHSIHQKFTDISLVPIACPMIAGPAMITAVIAANISTGFVQSAVPVIFALTVNLVLMLFSIRIGAFLSRFNVLGALIRITGLIVATMGIQMILQGISVWVKTL